MLISAIVLLLDYSLHKRVCYEYGMYETCIHTYKLMESI